MSKIIQKTIAEVVEEAGTPNPSDPGTGYMVGPYEIAETLWGLKCGALWGIKKRMFGRLGELRLPVQLHMYDQNGKREVASVTVFGENFCNGVPLPYSADEKGDTSFEQAIEAADAEFAHPLDFIGGHISGKLVRADMRGKDILIGIGYRDVGTEEALREHIASFFRLYAAAKEIGYFPSIERCFQPLQGWL